jgi:hypothetical protein
VKKVLKWSHCTDSKASLYARISRHKNQIVAETTPKDVAETAPLLNFAKPPPILGFLPSNESLNKIIHPPAMGSELLPKLYGMNLLKHPDFTIARKEIVKTATIKKLPGWADKTAVKQEMSGKQQRLEMAVTVDNFELNAEKAFAEASYS